MAVIYSIGPAKTTIKTINDMISVNDCCTSNGLCN